MKRTSIIIFLFIFIYLSGCTPPVVTDYGVEPLDPTTDPIQIDLSGEDFSEIQIGKLDLKLQYKAEYKVTAVVKSKKRYRAGWTSKISPYDLALVWGKLTDPEVDEHISYSQRNRWFYFKYDGNCPVTKDYIYDHGANTHVIPANKNLRRALRKIRADDTIYMEGYLVYVDGTFKNGEVWWHSSLSRNDRGDGACEVFYMTKLRIEDDIYD